MCKFKPNMLYKSSHISFLIFIYEISFAFGSVAKYAGIWSRATHVYIFVINQTYIGLFK